MPDAIDIAIDRAREKKKLKEDREKLQQYQNNLKTYMQKVMIKALNEMYDEGMTDEQSLMIRRFINKADTYAGKLHD